MTNPSALSEKKPPLQNTGRIYIFREFQIDRAVVRFSDPWGHIVVNCLNVLLYSLNTQLDLPEFWFPPKKVHRSDKTELLDNMARTENMAKTLIEKSIKAWSSYLIQESSVKTKSKLCKAILENREYPTAQKLLKILCVEPAVAQNCVPLLQTEDTSTKSMESIHF